MMYNESSGDVYMKRIIIVGGGASGMFAARTIKRYGGKSVDVVLLERQSRIGKKILATGNGKCNLSNDFLESNAYNHSIVSHWLEQFSNEDCKNAFLDMGMLTRSDEHRLYPYSEKANTLLDVLINELNTLGVRIICDFEVVDIKARDEFLVYSRDLRLLHSDYVFLATGGLASISFPQLGYTIANQLGHKITPLRAGLTPVYVREDIKSLAGIKVKCKASYFSSSKILKTLKGEVLFKD